MVLGLLMKCSFCLYRQHQSRYQASFLYLPFKRAQIKWGTNSNLTIVVKLSMGTCTFTEAKTSQRCQVVHHDYTGIYTTCMSVPASSIICIWWWNKGQGLLNGGMGTLPVWPLTGKITGRNNRESIFGFILLSGFSRNRLFWLYSPQWL